MCGFFLNKWIPFMVLSVVYPWKWRPSPSAQFNQCMGAVELTLIFNTVCIYLQCTTSALDRSISTLFNTKLRISFTCHTQSRKRRNTGASCLFLDTAKADLAQRSLKGWPACNHSLSTRASNLQAQLQYKYSKYHKT